MTSIGLVLGAGGVVGRAWHAGVLAALAEVTGWDARDAAIIVGTSAGSVVGTLLRGSLGPSDLYAYSTGGTLSAEGRETVRRAGLRPPTAAPERNDAASARYSPASVRLAARAALRPWQARPGLVLAGILPRGTNDTSHIGGTARALHGDSWPDRPLWVCTVVLADGRRVVFGRDDTAPVDIGAAVEASCAVPGHFRPVEIHGRDHVDGGVHSPTNADVLAGLDLDLVVVSSPMSLDRSAMRRPAVDRMVRIGHRMALQREVTVLRNERTEVVTLQPGIDDIAVLGPSSVSMDPARRRPVAERARETTLRRLASDRLRGILGALTP
jgi:NTE family protein